MNIKEINQQIKQSLQTNSPTPDLDATLILGYVLGMSKIDLIMQESYILSDFELGAINECLKLRLNKTPMAYILGYKEFYGREFIVNKNVLIPRPETEAIIDMTKDILNNKSKSIIWEIGTGSGCIAITLNLELPQAIVVASDISKEALQIAKNNDIILTGTQSSIIWLEGDLLSPFEKEDINPNIIIANLPYLNQNQYQDGSILYEPNIALYSPQDGLEHYIRLLQEIKSRFVIYPHILLEINPEQVQILTDLVKSLYSEAKVKIYQDLQGQDRHILIAH
jgi:release factor glutamine methyltransferase